MYHLLILMLAPTVGEPRPGDSASTDAKSHVERACPEEDGSESGTACGPSTRERFLGRWRFAFGETEAETLVVFGPEVVTFDEHEKLKWEIDEIAEPGHIDFTDSAAPEIYRGIFRFEGDELQLVVGGGTESPRPTGFDDDEATDIRLIRVDTGTGGIP